MTTTDRGPIGSIAGPRGPTGPADYPKCPICKHRDVWGTLDDGRQVCNYCRIELGLEWKLHVEDARGVPWDETPAPRRFRHRHQGWTMTWQLSRTSWPADPDAWSICRCGAKKRAWVRPQDGWSPGFRFGRYFRDGIGKQGNTQGGTT